MKRSLEAAPTSPRDEAEPAVLLETRADPPQEQELDPIILEGEVEADGLEVKVAAEAELADPMLGAMADSTEEGLAEAGSNQ